MIPNYSQVSYLAAHDEVLAMKKAMVECGGLNVVHDEEALTMIATRKDINTEVFKAIQKEVDQPWIVTHMANLFLQ